MYEKKNFKEFWWKKNVSVMLQQETAALFENHFEILITQNFSLKFFLIKIISINVQSLAKV